MSDTNEIETVKQEAAPSSEARYSVEENSSDCPTALPNALYDHGTLVACHSDPRAAEACAEMMNAVVDMPGMTGDGEGSDTGSMEANDQSPPPERGPTTPGKEIFGNDPIELFGTHRPREPWEL